MRPMWVGSLSPQNCGKEICFNLTDTLKLKTHHISPFTWAYRELRAKCGAQLKDSEVHGILPFV